MKLNKGKTSESKLTPMNVENAFIIAPRANSATDWINPSLRALNLPISS